MKVLMLWQEYLQLLNQQMQVRLLEFMVIVVKLVRLLQ